MWNNTGHKVILRRADGSLKDTCTYPGEGASKGNAAMAQKDYPTAIDFYTQALALHPGNAEFLSNRAAPVPSISSPPLSTRS